MKILTKKQLPNIIPNEIEIIVSELKQSKNQEECLRKAYVLLTKKYRGYRIKTYTHFIDLFITNLDKLWQKSGFLHCTHSNYLLRILLVKSGFFKDEDIKTHWTLVWLVSPHQYLTVRLKDGRKRYVDMWGKAYGISFGDYAHGFNSSLRSIN